LLRTRRRRSRREAAARTHCNSRRSPAQAAWARRAALADPGVRQRLAKLAIEVPPPERLGPQPLAAYQKAEIEKWWPIVKAAGIKGE
jgi:tripartite-type tricarboxylate transporter receptor subunit TctC